MIRDIGVAFLSSPATEERIRAGKALLPAERLHLIPPMSGGPSYLAGDDRDRTRALLDLLVAPEVDIILAGRGGYGAVRLARGDLEEALREHPKPIMGFSDVTATLCLWAAHGVKAIHGPVLTQLPMLDKESLRRALLVLSEGVVPELDVSLTPLTLPLHKKGTIEGDLFAANLSVLETLIGLDYFPNLSGRVVLLEDVNEPPYKLDRMCTHLLQATSLSEAAAVVLGGFGEGVSMDPLVHAFRGKEIPLFSGAPLSHGPRNYPLAIGASARIRMGEGFSLEVEACPL